MARVKWDQMTDESQAMVKKVGLISIGGVVLLAFSKIIFPLIPVSYTHLTLPTKA